MGQTSTLAPARANADRESSLAERYQSCRMASVALAAPLSPEDQCVQSMPDASPTKWHLAHTTWFFETFILMPQRPEYRPFHPRFGYLFNSYYEAVGARHPRPQRGLLTRPGVTEVMAYRAHVDNAMIALLEDADPAMVGGIEAVVLLGINHEQQHQELMLTDILHLLSLNPLKPAYRDTGSPASPGPVIASPPGLGGPVWRGPSWHDYSGGVVVIGHPGGGFTFDNEGPRHQVLLRPFRLASQPVSNGAWKEFIGAGGYRRPEFWLSDGWAAAQSEGWTAPLHWLPTGEGDFLQFTLDGLLPLEDEAPVCHVSLYEADAFARWAGKRLPSEAEWEAAARPLLPLGNTLGRGALRPLPATADAARGGDGTPQVLQMFGDVWEWTSSAYAPYPGFRPANGAVGEYNGKFMCNQMVLRGGSSVTPDDHVRATYRNFFYPHQRWQFTGVRLAEDAA